jgi:hypothetical protein
MLEHFTSSAPGRVRDLPNLPGFHHSPARCDGRSLLLPINTNSIVSNLSNCKTTVKPIDLMSGRDRAREGAPCGSKGAHARDLFAESSADDISFLESLGDAKRHENGASVVNGDHPEPLPPPRSRSNPLPQQVSAIRLRCAFMQLVDRQRPSIF